MSPASIADIAELYDPVTAQWSATGKIVDLRRMHEKARLDSLMGFCCKCDLLGPNALLPTNCECSYGGVTLATWLFVTNPNASERATGSIQFTQDNGTPFNITFIDVDTGQFATTGNILTFQDLSPGQTRIYLSTGMGTLVQGFGTLNSGVRVYQHRLIFRIRVRLGPGNPGGPGAGLVGEAGVATVTGSLRQGVFFYTAYNFDTGIALANPDPANTANITLQIYDRNAIALSPPKVISLAPSNHLAIYVSQLYPSAVGLNGTLQITSSIPLAAACLRFSPSGAFTTLPVIPLP